jgi:hypothetical protein
MEMGNDHVGHLFRRISDFPDLSGIILLIERLKEFQPGVVFVAYSRIHKDTSFVCLDKEAAERHHTHILFHTLYFADQYFFGTGPNMTPPSPRKIPINDMELDHTL